MYLVSAVIRLNQELKSKRTAEYLASLVETDVTVCPLCKFSTIVYLLSVYSSPIELRTATLFRFLCQ